MEGFSLRDWALIHFLTWIAAGFKFPHVHQTRHYPWVCRSRLDGFRFGADISGYRTITGAALVGTSSRSGCTRASEAPSAYLPFSRNAGAGGETDSAMRRCVPRPNAISPTRCHVPCCALRAAAICDGRAKHAGYALRLRPDPPACSQGDTAADHVALGAPVCSRAKLMLELSHDSWLPSF
jgi:hypothetical protein